MPIAEDTVTDAAELQNVLTRYVDSIEGYTQAAAVVGSPHLASAFLDIAQRRKTIAEQVARLIVKQGEKPDISGSPDGALHRWWIRLRVGMSDEEFRATLAECVRGEQELARTIQEALEHGNLDETHAKIVAEVARELTEALKIFQTVLNH
jgi:uncharacterized protein (TIGR02284 family)